MLIIKNGLVTDPVTGTEELLDLAIEGDTISRIARTIDPDGETGTEGRECTVIDAAGCRVCPGLIDTHVHFRDPGFTEKECIETGAAAAKKGGFTTVICMANTRPAVDCEEILARNLAKGRETGIHVLQAVTVTKEMKGRELVDLEALARAGAAGFTDDGLPILDEKLLYEAMQRACALGLPLSLHEEDPAFLASQGVNQGRVSETMGLGGASALAEEVLTARDCAMALRAGTELVIQHISSGNSVNIIRAFKAMGAHIHAEATPHHFTLTEDDVLTYGTYARMNPPLRTAEDREEIIKGLMDGTIDLIATDHAPHTSAEKARPFAEAPSGITGLETSLGLAVTKLTRTGRLTMLQLLEKMYLNPARLYHLPAEGLREGAPADIVIFNENETFTVGDFASRAVNSPFTGWTLYAPVRYTICGGKIVYERRK